MSNSKRSPMNIHIGTRVREARIARAWDQLELAEAMYTHRTMISLWEHGHRAISIANLQALALILNKPISFFLDFPEATGG